MILEAMILRRLAAFTYDIIFIMALLIIWTAILILFNKGQMLSPSCWYRFSLVLIIACYFIGFWRYGGQTSGMKAWGLKIISTKVENTELSYLQAFLRFILVTIFFSKTQIIRTNKAGVGL